MMRRANLGLLAPVAGLMPKPWSANESRSHPSERTTSVPSDWSELPVDPSGSMPPVGATLRKDHAQHPTELHCAGANASGSSFRRMRTLTDGSRFRTAPFTAGPFSTAAVRCESSSGTKSTLPSSEETVLPEGLVEALNFELKSTRSEVPAPTKTHASTSAAPTQERIGHPHISSGGPRLKPGSRPAMPTPGGPSGGGVCAAQGVPGSDSDRFAGLRKTLKSRLNRIVTDGELSNVRAALKEGRDGFANWRTTLLAWNDVGATSPPKLGETSEPARTLWYAMRKLLLPLADELDFYDPRAKRDDDDLFACKVLKHYLQTERFTLKGCAAVDAARGFESMHFMDCGRVFADPDTKCLTLVRRFIAFGPERGQVPLEWVHRVAGLQEDKVNFYSGPSGSGKTTNVCMMALGLKPDGTVEPGHYLMYLVPSAELKREEMDLEKEFADIEQRGHSATKEELDALRAKRDKKSEEFVMGEIRRLTPSCSAAKPLDAPDDPAAYKLTIVIDDIGAERWIARGICRRLSAIKSQVSKQFAVPEGNIRVALVGTGLDGNTNVLGSLPDFYTFYQFGSDDEAKPAIPGTAAFLQLLTKSSLTDSLKETLKNLVLNGDSEAAKNARQLVTNARCAALLIQAVEKGHERFTPFPLDQLDASRVRLLLPNVMPGITTEVVSRFRKLNGMEKLSMVEVVDNVRQALAVAARPYWDRKSLTRDQVKDKLCKLGILFDNARIREKVNRDAEADITAQRTDVDGGGFLVIDKTQRRYGIQEAYAMMALTEFATVSEHSPNWEGFEELLSDYCVLCALMAPHSDYFELVRPPGRGASPSLFRAGGWRPKGLAAVGESNLSTEELAHWALRSVLHYPGVRCARVSHMRQMIAETDVFASAAQLTDDAWRTHHTRCQGPTSGLTAKVTMAATFHKWRMAVEQGFVVVIKNGRAAKFADIIVIGPGKVVLLQAKETLSKAVDQSAEFAKLSNPDVVDALKRCCGDSASNPVSVYKVIVAVEPDSTAAASRPNDDEFFFRLPHATDTLMFPMHGRNYRKPLKYEPSRDFDYLPVPTSPLSV